MAIEFRLIKYGFVNYDEYSDTCIAYLHFVINRNTDEYYVRRAGIWCACLVRNAVFVEVVLY